MRIVAILRSILHLLHLCATLTTAELIECPADSVNSHSYHPVESCRCLCASFSSHWTRPDYYSKTCQQLSDPIHDR